MCDCDSIGDAMVYCRRCRDNRNLITRGGSIAPCPDCNAWTPPPGLDEDAADEWRAERYRIWRKQHAPNVTARLAEWQTRENARREAREIRRAEAERAEFARRAEKFRRAKWMARDILEAAPALPVEPPPEVYQEELSHGCGEAAE